MGEAAASKARVPAPLHEPAAKASLRLVEQRASAPESALQQVVSLCVEPSSAVRIAPERWPELLRVALEHGVAPLMYLRAREQAIPQSARFELARLYRANLARNLLLNHERQAVEAQLQEQNVPAVALKGPQLSESLYGDLGARQVADLDFLIRPEDLPAANKILASLGYERSAPEAIAKLQACRDVLYSKDAGPRSREPGSPKHGSRIFVDLHLRLRPYGKRDALAQRVMREARDSRDGMSPENLLLYLCLNLLTHRFARLQPYMDLVTFLQKEAAQLDWGRVKQGARELEWTLGVFYALRFAAQLEKARTPMRVLLALRPGPLERRWIEGVLGANAFSALARSGQLNGPWGTLAILGFERGLARKLQLAGSILFPPGPALRQMDVPSRKLALPLPLHYIERLARKLAQLRGPEGKR